MRQDKTHKHAVLLVAVALLMLFRGEGVAQQETPDVRSLEAMVGRWVELQALLDSEARDWEHQSARWRQEIELLRKEQAQMTSVLERLEQAGESQEQRSAGLLARRHELRETLAAVDVVLSRLKPRLAALQPLVPESLMTGDLRAAILAEGDEDASTAVRLQRALGALKGIEELHDGVHTARALFALPGSPRREMDVIFIGLARGFAVSMDDHVAAAGLPGEQGWQWAPVSAMAGDIRKLIRIARQEVPPTLVPLAVGATTGLRE